MLEIFWNLIDEQTKEQLTKNVRKKVSEGSKPFFLTIVLINISLKINLSFFQVCYRQSRHHNHHRLSETYG